MLNHFHRRFGRLRQLLNRGRWHCGLPRLCRRRGGVGGHVWRQVATVAVLGRYAPGGGDGGQLQNCGCMESLWMNGKTWRTQRDCRDNWRFLHYGDRMSIMLKNTNSRQERTSSVRSEKVTNLAPTAGKDVTLKKCGGRISPHHVIFLAEAVGRFTLYVPSAMSWVYAKKKWQFVHKNLLATRPALFGTFLFFAPSVRMKECPGALAAKMLLMKSVHQVLSGFWIQRSFL